MEANAVNENGFTVLDIIQRMPRDMKGMEIRECLVKAGALSSRNKLAVMEERGITMVIENPQLPPPLPPSTTVLTEAKAERPPGDVAGMKIKSKSNENKKDWMKKKRDSFMIAATLITGMTSKWRLILPVVFGMKINSPAPAPVRVRTIHGIQLDVLLWFAKHGVSGCKWSTFCEEKDLDVATYDYHVDDIIIHYSHLQDFYDGHLTRK